MPNGKYLIRLEHIALHVAGVSYGVQIYVTCGQLVIQDGGNGIPGPLVAFPGAYKQDDPDILIDIYPSRVWTLIDGLGPRTWYVALYIPGPSCMGKRKHLIRHIFSQ